MRRRASWLLSLVLAVSLLTPSAVAAEESVYYEEAYAEDDGGEELTEIFYEDEEPETAYESAGDDGDFYESDDVQTDDVQTDGYADEERAESEAAFPEEEEETSETAAGGLIAAAEDSESQGVGLSCGEKLTWTLDEDGVLTVSGSGPMFNFDEDVEIEDGEHYWIRAKTPWYSALDRIKKIVIEEGVTSVGRNAFAHCAAEEVTIASTVRIIDEYAFYRIVNLDEVVLPSSLERIGAWAFASTKLTEVQIPAGLQKIGESSFGYCSELKQVVFQEESLLRNIEMWAFQNCEKLTELWIPDGVQRIGSFVFNESGLKKLRLPSSLTYIGKGEYFKKLDVFYPGDEQALKDILIADQKNWDQYVTMHYLADRRDWEEWKDGDESSDDDDWMGAAGSCGDALTWRLEPDGTLFIEGEGAMYDYSLEDPAPWNAYSERIQRVSSFFWNDEATTIGAYAFYGCTY